LEATQAGLAAQTEHLKSIAGGKNFVHANSEVWKARQHLYSAAEPDGTTFAIAKFSTLPAQLANAVQALADPCADGVNWSAVVQATGIGCVRLEGEASAVGSSLSSFRASLEGTGGSLAVHYFSTTGLRMEAWGKTGDAQPLMREVKRQFDPRNTLNPGRFVGGI